MLSLCSVIINNYICQLYINCIVCTNLYNSGASVRPENAASYSAGNEGQNICSFFFETAPLPRSSAPSL